MLSTGIPRGLTHLIGRDSEVDSIRRLLRDTRLLTLTGAGGSGKTRLASEVATLTAGDFRDGAAWIELAPLNDGELLATHTLAALGLEHGARKPLDALLDALRPRHLLLVLDNCEHLVESCAILADRLLRECPDLRMLATSREALGVDGERAWLVPGLSLPSGHNESVDDLAHIPAVRLFVERAQSTLASFRLTPANAAAVTHIC